MYGPDLSGIAHLAIVGIVAILLTIFVGVPALGYYLWTNYDIVEQEK